ncbi:MAG TPA: ABC-F family ATP-binding cassette domain-containing protein [Anaerolineales bacterium]|nr:ABC-F family ATP-binding cassette domain-containing protein [Anaerolineales bacterium]
MLTGHHLSKSYNLDTILADVSLSISAGERVGLIGPNGCGKTTLLRILAGLDAPDHGVVTHDVPNLRIGYLPQGLEPDPALSMGELLQRAGGGGAAEADLAAQASALAHDPMNLALQSAYDEALRKVSEGSEARPEAILGALGLAQIPRDQPARFLSGGQKTRLALALVLLGEPNLLLLDEPTNHLDIEMLEWLEGWLNNFRGAALIVSHDRTFLDHTVTRILDLDGETRTLRAYEGNYSAYLEQYLAERERLMDAYRDQVYEIRRMEADINRTKQQSLYVEMTTTPRQPGVRRIAKKVARKAKSREKKLERYLESDERVEKPRQGWQMKLAFQAPEHLGQDVLVMEDLAVGYAGYPPLLSEINLHVRSGQRIVLTGANGKGKTTLLRTLAGQIDPLAGSYRLGSSIRLGYMAQEQETLNPERTALETIQALAPFNETEARSFLHFYLFTGDDPLRPVRSLSYGERARLSLAALVAQGSNFLLLDEPINHLDIPSRTRFEQALANFEGTILAVVHDRYFIERFANRVWLVEGGGEAESTRVRQII